MEVKSSTTAQNNLPVKEALPVKPVQPKPNAAASKLNNLDLKAIQDIVRQNKSDEVILSVPEKALATAIEHINKVVSGVNVEFRHTVHKESNTIVVTLIDKDTSDVILEIPPQKVLDAFIERMTLNGLYVDERR